MYRGLKLAVYTVSKALGLFHLSRLLTRKQLRILCYHSFSDGDEAQFRPLLFVSPATFERRLTLLKEKGFPVLRFQEAMKRLDEGDLPDGATVITIDDGWFSLYRSAYPILKKHQVPAVLYLTSYYFAKQTPVFRLVVSYMFWRTSKRRVNLDDLGVPAIGRMGELELSRETKLRLVEQISVYGDERCDNLERTRLSEALATELGVDYDKIRDERIFSLVSTDELLEMASDLLDIELHTHRHDFPIDPEAARKEILDNRAVIEPIIGRRLQHFCYPSGVWSEEHWPILKEVDVRTATTTEPGLVHIDSPRLALSRFLDSEEILDIEFEAELYGFSELLRQTRQRSVEAIRRLRVVPEEKPQPAEFSK